MIPDFKTYIKESVWSDIHRRSNGIQVRKEDEYQYKSYFEKIKKMELIDMSDPMDSGTKYLWTPCNFGSESYDQPGLYLSYSELVELGEFLKHTDYKMATESEFKSLITKEFGLKKTNGYWDYVFKSANSDKYLHIPGFGYVSGVSDKIYKPTKTQFLFYGTMFGDICGYVSIGNIHNSWHLNYHYLDESSSSDKLQVRLVKKA